MSNKNQKRWVGVVLFIAVMLALVADFTVVDNQGARMTTYTTVVTTLYRPMERKPTGVLTVGGIALLLVMILAAWAFRIADRAEKTAPTNI